MGGTLMEQAFATEIGHWQTMQNNGYFLTHRLYEGLPLLDAPDNPMRKRLDEYAGLYRSDDVLEIGCGYGRLMYGVAKISRSMTGIDVHESPLARGREMLADFPNVRFVLSDGATIPFPDDTFSLVYAFSVMQHLSRALVRQYFIEARRVLKLNGRILFQTYLNDNDDRNQRRELDPKFELEQSVAWTPGEFKNAASGLGLEIHTCTEHAPNLFLAARRPD